MNLPLPTIWGWFVGPLYDFVDCLLLGLAFFQASHVWAPHNIQLCRSSSGRCFSRRMMHQAEAGCRCSDAERVPGGFSLQAVKHTVKLLDAYGLRKEHLIEHLTELRQWVCPIAAMTLCFILRSGVNLIQSPIAS